MLELKKHLAAPRADLRRFGVVFTAITSLVSAYLAWKSSPAWPALATACVTFAILSAFIAEALRPFYVAWMALGALLAWINTRIILGIVFYLVMTPIGFLLKLSGKDILATKLEPGAATYWVKRPPAERGRERYKQMF